MASKNLDAAGCQHTFAQAERICCVLRLVGLWRCETLDTLRDRCFGIRQRAAESLDVLGPSLGRTRPAVDHPAGCHRKLRADGLQLDPGCEIGTCDVRSTRRKPSSRRCQDMLPARWVEGRELSIAHEDSRKGVFQLVLQLGRAGHLDLEVGLER